MRIPVPSARMAASVAVGGIGAVLGTALWARARGSGSWQERAAAVAFAPAALGFAALPVAAVAMLVPSLRPGARAMAAVGTGALAGAALGSAAARLADLTATHRHYPDAKIPPPDPARVRHHVEATRPSLDRSADNIVLWLPGTGLPKMPDDFVEAVERQFTGSTSVAKLPTHSSFDAPQGVADTRAAVSELVRELDAGRRPGQRIFLAGESQGAWAITLLMGDPDVGPMIDAAAALGLPGFAERQTGRAGSSDGRLVEMTHPRDAIGRPLRGDGELLIDVFGGLLDGDLRTLWRVPAAVAANPVATGLGIVSGLRALTGHFRGDPHEYSRYMPEAAGFLASRPKRS